MSATYEADKWGVGLSDVYSERQVEEKHCLQHHGRQDQLVGCSRQVSGVMQGKHVLLLIRVLRPRVWGPGSACWLQTAGQVSRAMKGRRLLLLMRILRSRVWPPPQIDRSHQNFLSSSICSFVRFKRHLNLCQQVYYHPQESPAFLTATGHTPLQPTRESVARLIPTFSTSFLFSTCLITFV